MYSYTVSLVVISYLLCILGLGIYSYWKTNTFADYILGGRKLGSFVGAMNVCTSDMSGWVLMAVPGAFYLHGMNQLWIVIGLITGSYWSWSFLARRLRCYTEIAGNSLTVASFLENRFVCKSVALRILIVVVIMLFFIIYIASGLVSSARLFALLYDVRYETALYVFGTATAFYAFLGGFVAVSLADALQGGLIFLVLIVIPFVLVGQLGDMHEASRLLLQNAPNHLNILYQVDFMTMIGALAWGLGYLGQPHIINKYMAMVNAREIIIGRRIAISWMTISFICTMIIGILGYIVFLPHMINDPEMLLVELAQKLCHPFVLGLVVIAIMSAVMSTLNAQILVCGSTVSEDIYRRFIRKDAGDSEMIMVTRMIIVLIVTLALLVAKDSSKTILELVSYAWSGLGASLGPTVFAALFSARMTKNAAIAGIASGAISVMIFANLPYFHYPIFPAFLISSVMIVIVSLFTKNDLSKDAIALFERMRSSCSAR